MLKYLVVLGPVLNVVTLLTEITEEQLLFTQTPLDLTQRISTVLSNQLFENSMILFKAILSSP